MPNTVAALILSPSLSLPYRRGHAHVYLNSTQIWNQQVSEVLPGSPQIPGIDTIDTSDIDTIISNG